MILPFRNEPMMRVMLKSKIHRATVTATEVDYVGSLTLDAALMEAADILPNEQIQVLNLSNGSRLTTYVIPGRRQGGEVCLNGAAALLASEGDLVILLSYGMFEDARAAAFKPKVVFVDGRNRPLKGKHSEKPSQRWTRSRKR
jgi:aspartate 1-decarboxylase